MDPAETRIIEVAKRHAVVGMQAAQAYHVEQTRLGLEAVLSEGRLSSAAGTAESLATLSQLTALTAAHKAAFQQFILSFAQEATPLLQTLPEATRAEFHERFVETINRQLHTQARFYADRERWIEAATAICHLIESRRATAEFTDDGVVFADDKDFETFEALLQTINEVHQLEVATMGERLDRIAKSASVLGLRIGH